MHSLAYLTPDKDIRRSRRFKVEAAWHGSIEARPDAMAAGNRSGVDARGCRVSGATPAALEAYEDALAAFLGWRSGADVPLASALQEAPAFVMAHVLQAWQLLCSRDPRRVGSARPVLARAAGLPANERERLHLAAIASRARRRLRSARRRGLGELLHAYPRDALALQAAHAFDYVTGDSARMRERVAAVLPAWSRELPGYHAVLAMHAFGLEECGDYAHAETGRPRSARRWMPSTRGRTT